VKRAPERSPSAGFVATRLNTGVTISTARSSECQQFHGEMSLRLALGSGFASFEGGSTATTRTVPFRTSLGCEPDAVGSISRRMVSSSTPLDIASLRFALTSTRPQEATAVVVCGDPQSDGRVAGAPDHRSVSVGQKTAFSGGIRFGSNGL
jgi:hypothetical protein